MNESNPEGIAQGQPQSQAPMQQQQATQAPVEKTLPQDRINDIVRDAFSRGHEKGTKEALGAGSIGGMSADDYRRIAREEAQNTHRTAQEAMQKQNEEHLARQTLSQVDQKIAETKASNRYPDFDETIKSLGLEHMLPLVWHANTVDNTADVLYDLGKNKMKLGMLNSIPPHLIPGEIKKLSDSIKANQNAESSANLPPDPFGNVKPSSGAGIGKRPSERTASEWAQHYKGRVRGIR
ncbi:MAG TPA: hypothetical protein VHZ76_00955 [Gammaproteobacteria bacterium]|jgi:hypothetical protein|nr:hypothetical protein [Gammaproteobacteria bacterium]